MPSNALQENACQAGGRRPWATPCLPSLLPGDKMPRICGLLPHVLLPPQVALQASDLVVCHFLNCLQNQLIHAYAWVRQVASWSRWISCRAWVPNVSMPQAGGQSVWVMPWHKGHSALMPRWGLAAMM